MLGDHPLKLGHELAVATEGEFSVDPVLGRDQPHLSESLDLNLGEGLGLEIRQGPAAPERLRFAQRGGREFVVAALRGTVGLRHQVLEHVEVQFPGINPQAIAGSLSDQARLRRPR